MSRGDQRRADAALSPVVCADSSPAEAAGTQRHRDTRARHRRSSLGTDRPRSASCRWCGSGSFRRPCAISISSRARARSARTCWRGSAGSSSSCCRCASVVKTWACFAEPCSTRLHGADASRFQLSIDAVRAIYRYDWPMNTRELENCLATATALAADGVIQRDHLPQAIRDTPTRRSKWRLPRCAPKIAGGETTWSRCCARTAETYRRSPAPPARRATRSSAGSNATRSTQTRSARRSSHFSSASLLEHNSVAHWTIERSQAT